MNLPDASEYRSQVWWV